jgi:signal transduction histidine kinase
MPDREIIKSKTFYKKSLFLASLLFGVLFVADIAVILYLSYKVSSNRLLEHTDRDIALLEDQYKKEIRDFMDHQGPGLDIFYLRRQEIEIQQYVDGILRYRARLLREEVLDEDRNVLKSFSRGPGEILLRAAQTDRTGRMEIRRRLLREEETLLAGVPQPMQPEMTVVFPGKEEWRQQQVDQLQSELLPMLIVGSLISLGLMGLTFIYALRLLNRSRRLEAEAQIADRLAYVGSLASGLAHEIRNPLNAMGVNLQMLDEEIETTCPANEGEVRSMVSGAMAEVQRLNLLVTQFLDYARPVDPEFVDSDLNQIVSDILDFLQADMDSARIQVHRDLSPQVPRIPVDARQIRQALLNILLNAKQVQPEGGRIDVITAMGSRGDVQIAIRDDGPGIPLEERDKIFRIFYSTKGGGTGMGLPIARKILENHGGTIEVETGPGEGTCFTLILPHIRRSRDSRQEKLAGARLAGAGAASER